MPKPAKGGALRSIRVARRLATDNCAQKIRDSFIRGGNSPLSKAEPEPVKVQFPDSCVADWGTAWACSWPVSLTLLRSVFFAQILVKI